VVCFAYIDLKGLGKNYFLFCRPLFHGIIQDDEKSYNPYIFGKKRSRFICFEVSGIQRNYCFDEIK